MKLISGSSGNNKLNGTDQDDLFLGLAGNDTLIGGAGTDTAWVSGGLAGYTFASVAGRLVVRDIAPVDGNDGVDTLSGIEQVRFGGGSQLTVSGGEFRVNTTTALEQKEIAFTGLNDGGFVAAWASATGSLARANSFFQRYDAVGGNAGGEVNAAVDPLNDRSDPTIAAFSDGGFVMVWQQEFSLTDIDIKGARFDASGARIANFTVSSSSSLEGAPRVAVLDSGGFVVTWQTAPFDGSGSTVLAQRYNSSAVVQGGPVQVNTFTTNDQSQPEIASLTNGGYVITWVSVGQDAGGNGVFAQRFNANGGKDGTEFRASQDSSGDQSAPAIAALANGGFVIVSQSSGGDNDGYGIVQSGFDIPGTGDFLSQVNRTEGGDQKNPAIAALADGGYVVAWESPGQDGGGVGIYAKRFDRFGSETDVEFKVNTTTAGDQTHPTIASLADGGFIIGWTSSDGDSTGVFAQRYDAAGNPEGLKLAGTASGDVINMADGQLFSVDGAGGNDTINGSATDDALYGGLGLDQLKGNAGNDWLDGGGGNDTLTGGAGDDDYVVDATGDVVTELAGGGTDTVHSAVNFVLSANLENLELTGNLGINGTGNAGGNFITGNSNNNRIDGGAGGDVMAGRDGSDTYIVDSDADIVIETAADGDRDQILSSIGVSALTDNVENLTLTGTAVVGNGNALANDLQGNALANNMIGFAGNDTVNGGAGNDTLFGGDNNDTIIGGAGNDQLSGGDGADVFMFGSALLATNLDHIDDFTSTTDQIQLSASVFTGLVANGSLPRGAFRSGAGFTTANDADDRIIYNTTNGDLFYDRDGFPGPAAAVKFAVLDGAPTLAASDFFVTT